MLRAEEEGAPVDKIVIGYDGSDSAKRAAKEIAPLAKLTGAEVHIVHVVEDDAHESGMAVAYVSEVFEQAAAARKEGVVDLAAEGAGDLAASFPGVTIYTAVLSGPPARMLIEHAESIEADLIVVGNRRVQGISRVLGSVAIDVLRHAPCSVYVARTT